MSLLGGTGQVERIKSFKELKDKERRVDEVKEEGRLVLGETYVWSDTEGVGENNTVLKNYVDWTTTDRT